MYQVLETTEQIQKLLTTPSLPTPIEEDQHTTNPISRAIEI
jgi:hypothetical protein